MKISASIFLYVVTLASLVILESPGASMSGESKGTYLVYVGTYTIRGSQGIYAYRFDERTGQSVPLGLVAKTTSPSFLDVDPSRRFLYAVNEVSPDNRFALAADLGLDKLLVYRFDAAKGSLAPNDPDSARVSGGLGPRHFVFHPSGKFVFLANEMGSAVTGFSYDASRGALGEIETVSTLPKGFAGSK